MSYQRVVLPRFMPCNIAWQLSRGVPTGNFALAGGGGTLNAGSHILDLVDGHPSIRCSFDTSGATSTTLLVTWDGLALTNYPFNFCAVLNHNIKSASGKIRVASDTNPITTGNLGTVVSAVTDIVNGSQSSGIVTPAADGDTLFTFTEITNRRYWSIQIQPQTAFSATDCQIGQVLLGCYYETPFSPDMKISMGTLHDGNRILETRGGHRWSTTGWLSGNDGTDATSSQPFTNLTGEYWRRNLGRRFIDLRFSYIADTALWDTDWATDAATTTFFKRVLGRIGMSHIPLVFGTTNSATSGDWLYGRLIGDAVEPERLAVNVWAVKMRIEEEF